MKIISIVLMLLGVGVYNLYAEKPSGQLTVVEIKIESVDDDMAKGDKSKDGVYHAFGCLQIWQDTMEDYNKAHGTNYQAIDCLGNRKLSLEVYSWYIDHYATEKRLGHKPTDEDKARIWNGGPSGCFDNGAINKNGALLKNLKLRARLVRRQAYAKNVYWPKVQRQLMKLELVKK